MSVPMTCRHCRYTKTGSHLEAVERCCEHCALVQLAKLRPLLDELLLKDNEGGEEEFRAAAIRLAQAFRGLSAANRCTGCQSPFEVGEATRLVNGAPLCVPCSNKEPTEAPGFKQLTTRG